MKHPLIALFLLFFAHSLFSQTDDTEYAYMSKGYAFHMDHGLDVKDGYAIEDLGNWGIDFGEYKRQVTFLAFNRTKDGSQAGVIMKMNRTDNGYQKFLAIPHDKSTPEIWEKAFQDFQTAFSDLSPSSAAYVWGMLRFIAYQFSGSTDQ